MNDITILYEDKYILIVEKPVGAISQSRDDGGECLPRALREYRRSKGEDEYIGVVHRLDAVTGGVIVYSKDKKLTGRISDALSQDHIKEYICICHGILTGEGEMRDHLYHDRIKNKSFVVSGSRKGAKEAVLQYRSLAVKQNDRGEDVTLLAVRLLTGRTHQIRVQFSSRAHSLCGDGKYGSRDNRCSCALWSYRCSFIHPVSNKEISVVSCPSDSYPWNIFSDILTCGDI